MRRFHDAFASSELSEIAPLVNSTAALLRETTYFSEAEKTSIRSHLERYAGALSIRTLPAIQVQIVAAPRLSELLRQKQIFGIREAGLGRHPCAGIES
jgi:hypothetical protein